MMKTLQICVILTGFTLVNFGVISAQLHKQMVVTDKANDANKVQRNFQNLFHSIAKTNTKKSANYDILKEEVSRGRQAFDSMKEELQTVRMRNAQKKRNIYEKNNINKNSAAVKREINENLGASYVNRTTTEFSPADLYDLGYFDGGWNKFCNEKTIDEEYAYFPEHEAKKLRVLLCHMRDEKKFDKQFKSTCVVYKYCMAYKQRVDRFIETFVDTFSLGDPQKKKELVAHFDKFNKTTCFTNATVTYKEKCIAPENPYYSMFDDIFARACSYYDLTTNIIVNTIKEVCEGKFMTDEINFKPYYSTINFRSLELTDL